MANEFKVKNGLITEGDITVRSGSGIGLGNLWFSSGSDHFIGISGSNISGLSTAADFTVQSEPSISGNGRGGSLFLKAGYCNGLGGGTLDFGGNVYISGGDSFGSTTTTGSVGNINLKAGSFVAGTSTNGEWAGGIFLYGGNTIRSLSATLSSSKGGTIALTAGNSVGSGGIPGNIRLNAGSGSSNTGPGHVYIVENYGNVLIGAPTSSTPTSVLQVRGRGTTTGNSFLVEDNSQNARLSVLDTGSVGINVGNPSSASLQVRGINNGVSSPSTASYGLWVETSIGTPVFTVSDGRSLGINTGPTTSVALTIVGRAGGTGGNKTMVIGSTNGANWTFPDFGGITQASPGAGLNTSDTVFNSFTFNSIFGAHSGSFILTQNSLGQLSTGILSQSSLTANRNALTSIIRAGQTSSGGNYIANDNSVTISSNGTSTGSISGLYVNRNSLTMGTGIGGVIINEVAVSKNVFTNLAASVTPFNNFYFGYFGLSGSGGSTYAVSQSYGLWIGNASQVGSQVLPAYQIYQEDSASITRNYFGAKVGIGYNQPSASLHIRNPITTSLLDIVNTTSSVVARYESIVSTGTLPNKTFIQSKVLTTDATLTPIVTQSISASTLVNWEGTILARRTNGTGSSADESATYKIIASCINTGSLATMLSPFTVTSSSFGLGSNWRISILTGSNNFTIAVSGSASANITWHLHLDSYTLFN